MVGLVEGGALSLGAEPSAPVTLRLLCEARLYEVALYTRPHRRPAKTCRNSLYRVNARRLNESRYVREVRPLSDSSQWLIERCPRALKNSGRVDRFCPSGRI